MATSQGEPPLTHPSLGKVLRLAELLGEEDGAAAAALVVQRITREVMWGVHSSLGVTGDGGVLLLNLEGFVSYHRREDAAAAAVDGAQGKPSYVYRGQKFSLGNLRIELDHGAAAAAAHTPRHTPGLGSPESVATPYSSPAMGIQHSSGFNPLAMASNITFPSTHQASAYHTLAQQKAMVLGPQLAPGQLAPGQLSQGQLNQGPLSQGQLDQGQLSHSQLNQGQLSQSPLGQGQLSHDQLHQGQLMGAHSIPLYTPEDSGRKRTREQGEVAMEEDSDSEVEESYIDSVEENLNIQRLQLHTTTEIRPPGGSRSSSSQMLTPTPPHESVPQSLTNLNMATYPSKGNRIGSSRPRKRLSPSSPSGSHFGDTSSPTSKRKSGMSLVERVWRGIYEGTKLSKQLNGEIGMDIMQAARAVSMQLKALGASIPMTQQAFREINTHCSSLYSSTCSFRILDLIMQAIWVDLFHARIAALAAEPQNQYNSPTDNNILALKECWSIFGCTEKEIRNKLAIWSGYKKIKDVGGWPALIFAEEGGGVYNVCKYRGGGWKDGIFDELARQRDAIEFAADTLQPEWRRLLTALFGPDEAQGRGWEGEHPHSWVIGLDGMPIPLGDTYRGGLEYELIEQSVVDEEAWPNGDPRRVLMHDDEEGYVCSECSEVQSEEVLGNKCLCYPDLYGGGASRRGGKFTPVQVFRTSNGKGNGLLARLPLAAGAGVGEFVGTITKGLRGVDVMEGGVDPNKYQISQARRGNFTRFINHSCNPNTHFERFVWLGIERIIIVSNGVKAGTEITVDYSNGYWEGLDKACKCGEEGCRYPRASAVGYGGV
ncbi:hypothetical protein BDZ91DRAFT_790552 [Kalaharituber pfeilii]|nr:hypothetical protein BDZ91DRAFT_790552 [Kalaharituber pfeilii]